MSGAAVLVRIAQWAQRRPEATAVREQAGTSMSYAQLMRMVDAVSLALRSIGLTRGQVVAIPAIQNADTIAAMLGIMAADLAFVVMDPASPISRRHAMSQAAGVAAELQDAAAAGNADAWADPRIDAPSWSADADSPAYVVFTSGSTGTPKGSLISQRSLDWHALTMCEAYGLSEGDRVLQATSPLFDVAMEEIWPTLVSGASVVIPERPLARIDFASFTRMVEQLSISVCNLPSSYFAGWTDHLTNSRRPPNLRLVIAGSEPLAPSTARKWHRIEPSRPCRLIHAYGLSEATITSIVYHTQAGESEQTWLPVGRTLPGVEAIVVDPFGDAVTSGEPGELWLSGEGLAMRYTDEAADADRFVDVAGADGRTRWLRTGDIASVRDELVRIHGRFDEQVKIAGRRIELGDVTAAFLSLLEVSDARTVLSENQLVTFVVGREIPMDQLRKKVADLLPAHMVPNDIRWLDSFPTTTGGKVDLEALRRSVRPVAERSTVRVDEVAALWMGILNVDSIDQSGSFFELGGNSLTAARLVAQLRNDFGVDCTLADFFAAPRFGDFVRLLAGRGIVH
jgi:amino acid adenylation domain-containing protein